MLAQRMQRKISVVITIIAIFSIPAILYFVVHYSPHGGIFHSHQNTSASQPTTQLVAGSGQILLPSLEAQARAIAAAVEAVIKSRQNASPVLAVRPENGYVLTGEIDFDAVAKEMGEQAYLLRSPLHAARQTKPISTHRAGGRNIWTDKQSGLELDEINIELHGNSAFDAEVSIQRGWNGQKTRFSLHRLGDDWEIDQALPQSQTQSQPSYRLKPALNKTQDNTR